MPKALARTPDGEPWLHRAVAVLAEGGCTHVLVVLGALAETAIHLVPTGAEALIARDWNDGQGASLRTGLQACGGSVAPAVLVTLVDLPDLVPAAVRRVVTAGGPDLTRALARASYAREPGHPVLIGREHWGALSGSLAGDRGAAGYLGVHGVTDVDCTELGGGDDVDRQDPGAPSAGPIRVDPGRRFRG
ncbi:MAG: nucleotidyltransferase family protein [Marmoricola sp.]|nr:nucleotidyltransferase family protein [Marmoricola sp.]